MYGHQYIHFVPKNSMKGLKSSLYEALLGLSGNINIKLKKVYLVTIPVAEVDEKYIG